MTKLNKIVEKPCKYCTKTESRTDYFDIYESTYTGNDYRKIKAFIMSYKNKIIIRICGHCNYTDIKINFCPICGKDLTAERIIAELNKEVGSE